MHYFLPITLANAMVLEGFYLGFPQDFQATEEGSLLSLTHILCKLSATTHPSLVLNLSWACPTLRCPFLPLDSFKPLPPFLSLWCDALLQHFPLINITDFLSLLFCLGTFAVVDYFIAITIAFCESLLCATITIKKHVLLLGKSSKH